MHTLTSKRPEAVQLAGFGEEAGRCGCHRDLLRQLLEKLQAAAGEGGAAELAR
jgi:hypothetical protein